MGNLLVAFIAEIGLITYRDLAGKDPNHLIAGLPLPADYMAAVALFGILGLAPKDSPAAPVAGLIGWAFVVATWLNALPGVPKSGTSSTTSAAPAPSKSKGTVA